MERLRTMMVDKLRDLLVWLVLTVAPKPPLPAQKDWEVKLDKNADVVVWVLFQRSIRPKSEFHVESLVDFGVGPLMLVGDPHKLHLYPLHRDVPLNLLCQHKAVQYCVKVRVSGGRKVPFPEQVGAASCVDTVVRLLGMTAPGVYTPRQLLAELWRKRHG